MMLKYIDKTRKLRTLTKRGYIILSLLFVSIITGIFYNLDRLNDTYRQSADIAFVHSENISLFKSASDMSTGFRGYMLYKSKDFLKSYYDGAKNYDFHLRRIKSKLSDEDIKNYHLLAIDSRIKLWQAKTSRIISTNQLPSSWPGREQDTMVRQINSHAVRIQKIENDRLAKLSHQERSITNLIIVMAFFGSFLPLALAFLLSYNFVALANDVALGNDSLMEELQEKKELETKLFKALALQSSVQKFSPTPVIIIEENGKVIDFNVAAEETFCVKKHEIVGRDMVEVLFPEKQRVSQREKLLQLINNDDLLNQTTKINMQTCGGTVVQVELHVAHVNMASQSYFVCFINPAIPTKKVRKNGSI